MNSQKSIIRIACMVALIMSVFTVSYSQKQNPKKEGKTLSFSDFNYTDIGTATKTGTTKIANNELEIVAGGADIWGKHDEFRFGYELIQGDFDVSVQIMNLSKANQYTKAGIMARTNLTDSSQHVYFQIFPDNSPRNKNNGGCEFQYRTTAGADMKAIYPDMQTAGNQFDVVFPTTWIRLKRQGDVFESYFSSDNKAWKRYSTFTLKMPYDLMVGLAVTSHNSGDFTTAKFGTVHLLK